MCGDNSVVRSCTFIDNVGEDGGAIVITGTNAAVIDCMFESNSAASFGGGLFVHANAAASALNCQFVGNASDVGNAIANRGSLTAVNCVLSGNDHPFSSHSGVYNLNGDLSIINCTINHNKSDGQGGGVFNNGGDVSIINSILWANGTDSTEGSQVFNQGGSVSVEFCCVQGWTGGLNGEANFASNPKFMDAAGADNSFGTRDDDVRLASDSPCRDAGDASALPNDEFDLDEDGDTAEPIPVDLDFHDRVSGPAVDLGAFESE
jgi:hypothetical protein